MRVTAIIVAAGSGLRMGGDVPKQFLLLHERPVLYYTLKVFEEMDRVDSIVVVTGEDYVDHVRRDIVEKYGISKVSSVVKGGAERTLSVMAGLSAAEQLGAEIVLIHDGVRPFVTEDVINRVIDATDKYGACVPGVPVKDTIKVVGAGTGDDTSAEPILSTPDRRTLRAIQTPQGFKPGLLKKAYDKALEGRGSEPGKVLSFSDDAVLVEQTLGIQVYVVPGDYSNIKITTPDDLIMAEYLSCIKN